MNGAPACESCATCEALIEGVQRSHAREVAAAQARIDRAESLLEILRAMEPETARRADAWDTAAGLRIVGYARLVAEIRARIALYFADAAG